MGWPIVLKALREIEKEVAGTGRCPVFVGIHGQVIVFYSTRVRQSRDCQPDLLTDLIPSNLPLPSLPNHFDPFTCLIILTPSRMIRYLSAFGHVSSPHCLVYSWWGPSGRLTGFTERAKAIVEREGRVNHSHELATMCVIFQLISRSLELS